ncbi:hypothetical protein [Streptomyces halobius]|uniref:Queuine tRNA-ribosyltransferase n=1 Tax=Streptomyces halobius TaxID=2879846 RepID=A0ABY4MGZ9_9ACTN|nr:hypothetical protein [Streptomyces halobius]UQA95636.1 hypothetical protein K9S39_30610 [Streptomyces halobius]
MNTLGGTDQPFKALCSFAFWRPKDMRKFTGKLATPVNMIFGDSGAHSARTMGIHLTLEDYASWCQKWDRELTLYANLDVIGGPEATWRNQKELELYGLEPIPVFHTGDPWEYLERYLDEGYTYIALGKLLGNPVSEVLPWLAKAFRLADGRAVFHGFGMTVWRALREFPFYSVDSSSWGQGFRFGVIQMFDPSNGTWTNFMMRDRDALLRHRELVRAHHISPLSLATRKTYSRTDAIALAAVAWRRAEEYLRARHGPITIPPGPHNPVTRGGARPATPGLHLYLAEANSTNLYHAAAGIQAARQEAPTP